MVPTDCKTCDDEPIFSCYLFLFFCEFITISFLSCCNKLFCLCISFCFLLQISGSTAIVIYNKYWTIDKQIFPFHIFQEYIYLFMCLFCFSVKGVSLTLLLSFNNVSQKLKALHMHYIMKSDLVQICHFTVSNLPKGHIKHTFMKSTNSSR